MAWSFLDRPGGLSYGPNFNGARAKCEARSPFSSGASASLIPSLVLYDADVILSFPGAGIITIGQSFLKRTIKVESMLVYLIYEVTSPSFEKALSNTTKGFSSALLAPS